MSCITIAKEIKSIHPEDVALIKLGGFYKVYGKDAYILSYIYMIISYEVQRTILSKSYIAGYKFPFLFI